MRDIRFRAWGKNSKEYLGYGTKDGISLTLKNIQNIEDLDNWVFEQDTGLKDKNGETIWEGDTLIRKTEVVKDGYVFDTYTVEFFNGKFYGVSVDTRDELDCEDFEDCEIKKGEQNENN